MAISRLVPSAYNSALNISEKLEVEYIVVAGGGGGRGGGDNVATDRGGAAGGAGGYRSSVSGEDSGGLANPETPLRLAAGNYTVTIGAGGAAGTGTNRDEQTSGGNTTFHTIVSLGGGCGGSSSVEPVDADYNGPNGGIDGGSGGGCMGTTGGTAPDRARGQAGQGFAGGTAGNGTSGGGGGGAGGLGTNGTSSGTTREPGGAGISSSITGTPTTYAKGGDGGAAKEQSDNAVAGPANTGQGGDGGNLTRVGAAGGSGVVIIRYPDTNGQLASGGTVTHPSGYYVHSFTSSGTFTVNGL